MVKTHSGKYDCDENDLAAWQIMREQGLAGQRKSIIYEVVERTCALIEKKSELTIVSSIFELILLLCARYQ